MLNKFLFLIKSAFRTLYLASTVLSKSLPRSNETAVGYMGHLRQLTKLSVRGWAKSSASDQVIDVDIFINDVKVKTIEANLYREFLVKRGISKNGTHGFFYQFEVELSIGDVVAVKPSISEASLKGSPKKLDSNIRNQSEWIKLKQHIPGENIKIWSDIKQSYIELVSIVTFNIGFIKVISTSFSKNDREVFVVRGGNLLARIENEKIILYDQSNRKVKTDVYRYLTLYEAYTKNYQESPIKDKGYALALGSKRLGDYLAQLNWLSRYKNNISLGCDNNEITKIFVNRSEVFFDPSILFPWLKENLEWVDSWQTIYHESACRGFSSLFTKNYVARNKESNIRNLRKSFIEYASSCKTPKIQGNFVILISLELEKRIWVNQVEVYKAVTAKLLNKFSSLTIIVNGMTGKEYGEESREVKKMIEKERVLVKEMFHGFDVDLIDLSGQTLRVKSKYISIIDMFIAPIGSATILPSLIFEKPGMTVGYTSRFTPSYRSYVLDSTWIPPPESIEDFPDINGEISWPVPGQAISYSIDQGAFMTGLKSVLGQLSN